MNFFCTSLIILSIFYNQLISANYKENDTTKSVSALRINNSPKLDGVLDDECWLHTLPAKDFVQLWPENGKPSRQKTEVRFVYEDKALYVGAMLYDTAPDSISLRLTKRDNWDAFDYFGIYIDPFNNSLSSYGFFVSSTNVQLDLKASSGENDNEDTNWDAVYETSVKINSSGWVVEMKIPYSALRFPKSEIQTWGINMFRKIARYNSNNSWCRIDNTTNRFIKYQGNLLGISNIKPPLRLSFLPYFSSYIQNDAEKNKWGSSFKGGMDVKLGLNESYTLDMILVPDFGQVQSDDIELNLTPFELYYSERRPFFTEGTEMFNKAGIFYSRRIGSQPVHYDEVEDQLMDNE